MLTPLNIVLFAIFLCLLVTIAFLVRMELRLTKLLRGKKAKDLEAVMIAIGDHIDHLEERAEALEQDMVNVEKRLKRSIQHVATVRFNPFKDQGSNQSFATALLDESGDGVVLSSLYAREKVSVYAKPIIARTSEHELSTEEKEAIAKARAKE